MTPHTPPRLWLLSYNHPFAFWGAANPVNFSCGFFEILTVLGRVSQGDGNIEGGSFKRRPAESGSATQGV